MTAIVVEQFPAFILYCVCSRNPIRVLVNEVKSVKSVDPSLFLRQLGLNLRPKDGAGHFLGGIYYIDIRGANDEQVLGRLRTVLLLHSASRSGDRHLTWNDVRKQLQNGRRRRRQGSHFASG